MLSAPDGQVQAQYDKIHMFDVELEDGERHHESAAYQAGDCLVTSEVNGVTLGLSICYDLRFPNLYRRLAEAGAQVIVVPSAFTKQTGEAHWHILLRARAIETGCFIVAPAQIGRHENGRETYGHSLIVNPWGRIIAEAEDGDALISAELDLSLSARARRQIPALEHGAAYARPDGAPTQD
jgi:predicted amidohydrolase